MTEISGKSLHEIYKEDARKYKESIAKERLYSESPTVTIPMEEFDKLQKLALSAHTDELSVEKLQEQLNTAKKALTEIASTRQWRGGTLVGFEATEDAQIAIDALAAIGGNDE